MNQRSRWLKASPECRGFGINVANAVPKSNLAKNRTISPPPSSRLGGAISMRPPADAREAAAYSSDASLPGRWRWRDRPIFARFDLALRLQH